MQAITNNVLSKYPVYYGIDKLNKIMKKPAISVVFENEPTNVGDHEKRYKKVLQRMHIVHQRKQTISESEDSKFSNRIFTSYSSFIFDKRNKGDIEFILKNNFDADKNHVSRKEREEIRNKLRKKIYEIYPDTKKGGTQLNLIFE